MNLDLQDAIRRDASDSLTSFRSHFYLPPDQIYLDGNSLGLLSRESEESVVRLMDEWRQLAIGGWTDANPDWFTLSERISADVTPLVGADADEVIVTGSTTLNLHQLLATLYDPNLTSRQTILADALAFPSDIHAIQSHLRLRGLNPKNHLRLIPSVNGRILSEETIIAALESGTVQMMILPSVVYTSGQLLDMPRITKAARERQILIGWDCSHSIGAIPHTLSADGADFAFWCHYKYLNAGPGSVGGLYLNRRHHDQLPGLAGWFGSDKSRQFDMAHDFTPASGAGRLQIGTPHLLSLIPLEGALKVTHAAGIENIRNKSLALTTYLMELVESQLAGCGFTFANPVEPERRGGHVALVHPDAVRIAPALRRVGVVPDYRPPDIIRFAPVALYTSFVDCWHAVRHLRTILETRSYEAHSVERGIVP